MICLFKRLQIKRIASKDANGLYGKFLIQYQKKLVDSSAINIDFQLSGWMRSLINDYKNTVEKLMNKQKDIVTMYTAIRQCYARFNEENSEFDKKKSKILSDVSSIEAEIVTVKAKINETSQLLSNFHGGKPLPNGLTPRKLNSTKVDLEQKLSQKQAHKGLISDITLIKNEHDKLIKNYRNKVIQLEYDFSEKINTLDKIIRQNEIKYNEQVGYYWNKLCEYIQNIYFKHNQYHQVRHGSKSNANYNEIFQITEPAKQLKDIASLCGTNLYSKKDLFKSERAFINTVINQSMDIQYEV